MSDEHKPMSIERARGLLLVTWGIESRNSELLEMGEQGPETQHAIKRCHNRMEALMVAFRVLGDVIDVDKLKSRTISNAVSDCDSLEDRLDGSPVGWRKCNQCGTECEIMTSNIPGHFRVKCENCMLTEDIEG